MLLCVQTSECWPTVNGAGSILHLPLFSLQAARSYRKRVLSRCYGAKGPGSKQNYPCHLNIHALFQHPSIYYVDISTFPSENNENNFYHKSQNYPSTTIFIILVYVFQMHNLIKCHLLCFNILAYFINMLFNLNLNMKNSNVLQIYSYIIFLLIIMFTISIKQISCKSFLKPKALVTSTC